MDVTHVEAEQSTWELTEQPPAVGTESPSVTRASEKGFAMATRT